MRRYFIECCFGMAWTKTPFTLSNIKSRVRRWEVEFHFLFIEKNEAARQAYFDAGEPF